MPAVPFVFPLRTCVSSSLRVRLSLLSFLGSMVAVHLQAVYYYFFFQDRQKGHGGRWVGREAPREAGTLHAPGRQGG